MMLREVTDGLRIYYSNANEAEKTIVNCAGVAAGAAAVGGFIPVLELPALVKGHLCQFKGGTIGTNIPLL